MFFIWLFIMYMLRGYVHIWNIYLCIYIYLYVFLVFLNIERERDTFLLWYIHREDGFCRHLYPWCPCSHCHCLGIGASFYIFDSFVDTRWSHTMPDMHCYSLRIKPKPWDWRIMGEDLSIVDGNTWWINCSKACFGHASRHDINLLYMYNIFTVCIYTLVSMFIIIRFWWSPWTGHIHRYSEFIFNMLINLYPSTHFFLPSLCAPATGDKWIV